MDLSQKLKGLGRIIYEKVIQINSDEHTYDPFEDIVENNYLEVQTFINEKSNRRQLQDAEISTILNVNREILSV